MATCSGLHKIPYSLIGRRPLLLCYLASINVSEWCIDFSVKNWTQVSQVFTFRVRQAGVRQALLSSLKSSVVWNYLNNSGKSWFLRTGFTNITQKISSLTNYLNNSVKSWFLRTGFTVIIQKISSLTNYSNNSVKSWFLRTGFTVITQNISSLTNYSNNSGKCWFWIQ